MTSFLFDRTVTLARQAETYPTAGRAQVGSQAYSPDGGVGASIQMSRSHDTGLATDDTASRRWLIYLDPAFVDVVTTNDVATDDLGRAFKVLAAYPSPLGYKLECQDWTTGTSRAS